MSSSATGTTPGPRTRTLCFWRLGSVTHTKKQINNYVRNRYKIVSISNAVSET